MSCEDKKRVSEVLCFDTTKDLGMYLGMPTLTSRVTKDTFGYLCEKIDRRLAGWKTKYLSLAGRITLAKSTVSTIASYAMQSAKIPKAICDDIDKKTRRFFGVVMRIRSAFIYCLGNAYRFQQKKEGWDFAHLVK